MFGRNEVNKNGRERYNKEMMQTFGDLDILSFVRKSRLNCFGHVNRMDSKKITVKYLTITSGKSINNAKTYGVTVYKYILINAKLKTGKKGQETELIERSILRKRTSTVDSSGIEEEEEETMVCLRKTLLQM